MSETTYKINQQRESKMLWVNDGQSVRELQCLKCDTKGYWWCPEAGFSGAEGYQIFETKRDALLSAIQIATQEWTRIDRELTRLKMELSEQP